GCMGGVGDGAAVGVVPGFVAVPVPVTSLAPGALVPPGGEADAAAAGSSKIRGNTDGTCTTAMMFWRGEILPRSRCSEMARLRLRLRRIGKGCPGSTASGVSTGQT